MTSATVMERTGTMGMPGMGYPGYGQPTFGTPGYGTTPFTTPFVNVFSVPRCTYKVERCQDGFKVNCVCDDQAGCSVMQNLCMQLNGGSTCCTITCNGMTVCTYNCTMGVCRWETTDKGVCCVCTSGDTKVCAALQTWCDCMTALINAGCYCTFYCNNTPVCCGCCETTKTPATKR